MAKPLYLAGPIAFVVGVAGIFFIFAARPALSESSTSILGYARSETIGWVDLNCSNQGICGSSNFGLSIAQNGDISGYAWSENIGWIEAYTASNGCPQSPCAAKLSGNQFRGWLKAVSGESAQSGGWDGWISLKGSNPEYGVTLSNGVLSGYAWGDTNVGWLDFSYASTNYAPVPPCQATQGYFCDSNTSKYRDAQCVVTTIQPAPCSYACAQDTGVCVTPPAPSFAAEGTLRVNPELVTKGQTVTVSWQVANASSCDVTGTNGDSWSTTSGTYPSSPILSPTTFTILCTGEGGSLTESVTVLLNPEWVEI